MNEFEASIIGTAVKWHEAGRKFCLATVIETWGSAPLPIGSQMLIDQNQHFVGSVSGGCVEGAVVLEAGEVLKNDQSKVLSYAVSNELAFNVGLSCGGEIKVFIESFDDDKAAVLKQIVKYRRRRIPCVCAIDLTTGKQHLVTSSMRAGEPLKAEFDRAFSAGCSHVSDDKKRFFHLHDTSLKLIIIGAVHIAQSLVPLAKVAGFDVVVIDPRESFASVERFGDVTLKAKWPDEALPEFDLDARTALVVLSHDPKIDDPALRIGLTSECFYIGALGSRKTHAARLERLQDCDNSARIDGPIGLDIGAKGANEIAFSIVGKLIQALRQK